jgi:hypothetical protein
LAGFYQAVEFECRFRVLNCSLTDSGLAKVVLTPTTQQSICGTKKGCEVAVLLKACLKILLLLLLLLGLDHFGRISVAVQGADISVGDTYVNNTGLVPQV